MAKRDDEWKEAIKLCRLNQRTVAMAKALGMQPRSLIKNRPSKDQRWKAPVHEWIQDLYRKRFGDREPEVTPPRQTRPL